MSLSRNGFSWHTTPERGLSERNRGWASFSLSSGLPAKTICNRFSSPSAGAALEAGAGLEGVAAASLTFNLYFFYLPSYLATALGVPLARTLAAAIVGLVVVAALLARGRWWR